MLQFKVITDITTEPVTLQEVKDFMSIDYTDYDSFLTALITASRIQSEKVSGIAYGAKEIEVTGNSFDEKVYPIGPYVSDVDWVDEDGTIDYRYNAGLSEVPEDLKLAIKMRVATSFANRENESEMPSNKIHATSEMIETKYRDYLAW